jgi:hypothetical protein
MSLRDGAEPADVAEYEAMMASPHTGLRAAVVILKVAAAIYLVVGVATAILAYSKLATAYEHYQAALEAPGFAYASAVEKPSVLMLVTSVLRDAFVAFFVFVSGDVIKLQLAIRDDVARLRAKAGL